MKKRLWIILVLFSLLLSVTACGSGKKDSMDSDADTTQEITEEPVELLVAAAASLQNSMEDLKELYEKEHKNVTITFTFGASGALQTQIEQGAPVDVFMSAAVKQMTALESQGYIADDTKIELLENKLVLITPKGSTKDITDFKSIINGNLIAIGDPASVPAGQYAEEVFTSLGILDQVTAKANYGTDVTQVLNWVSGGNVDAGVVYATDAASADNVTIVAEAPEGSCSKVIYPVAVVKNSEKQEAASEFTKWLASDEAMKVFESYGFTDNR